MKQTPFSTSYRTVKVNGWSVFYREAGPPDAPTILLAPDYPGFGHSDALDWDIRKAFWRGTAALIHSFLVNRW
jgi:pimeloyl-ACP methyl ester carboxylesterase